MRRSRPSPGPDLDRRLQDAYFEHCRALARAGTIDDALTKIDDAQSYEARIVDLLRAAGKLAARWEDEEP